MKEDIGEPFKRQEKVDEVRRHLPCRALGLPGIVRAT